MSTFRITLLNTDAEPIDLEADSATTDASSGKVTFHDADSNIVGQFVNVNFYKLPDPEQLPE